MGNLKFSSEELAELNRDEQHTELMGAFLQFVEIVRSGSYEKELKEAIAANSLKVEAVGTFLSQLKIEAPVVNVAPAKFEFNHAEIVKTIDWMVNSLSQTLGEVKKSNESLLKAIKELTEVNKADRIFMPKYGPLQRLENIIVSIKK